MSKLVGSSITNECRHNFTALYSPEPVVVWRVKNFKSCVKNFFWEFQTPPPIPLNTALGTEYNAVLGSDPMDLRESKNSTAIQAVGLVYITYYYIASVADGAFFPGSI